MGWFKKKSFFANPQKESYLKNAKCDDSQPKKNTNDNEKLDKYSFNKLTGKEGEV